MLLLVLCGCTDTDVMPKMGREVYVQLNLMATPATKAGQIPVGMESVNVHDLWVMQFDGTQDNASLISVRYYPDYTAGTRVGLFTSDIENSLLFIANTKNPSIEFNKCRTLSDVKRLKLRVTDDKGAAGWNMADDIYMYMNACVQTVVTGSAMSLDVPMKRNAVRLDVRVTNSTGGTENPITIDSVRVLSGVRDVFYFTDYTLPDIFPSQEHLLNVTYPSTAWNVGAGDGNSRDFTFYCPANKRGSIANANPKHKLLFAHPYTTMVQVMGTDSHGDEVSYRFILGSDLTSDCNLLPNTDYSYEFEITGAGDYVTDSRVDNLHMQDFTQSPLANSYIINPPAMEGVWKHVRIPVRRVYDFWNITDGYEKVAGNALDAGSFGWQAEIIRSTVELVENVNFKWIKRNGTDYTDYFEFAITAGMEGNFILGVHRFTDAGRTLLDDVFLWSWHMWVTDYNPSATISLLTPEVDGDGNEARYVYDVLGGQVNRYTGAMWKTGGALEGQFMMDRNLGALSQTEKQGPGTLYYQQGRKDPFFYATGMNGGGSGTQGVYIYNRYNDAEVLPFKMGTHLEAEGVTERMRYSIYHPETMLLIPNWVGAETDDEGRRYDYAGNWGDTRLGYFKTQTRTPDLNTKSMFDPCPEGWRVAPRGSISFPEGTVSVDYPIGSKSFAIELRVNTLPNGAVIYQPWSGGTANGGPSNNYTLATGINLWSNERGQPSTAYYTASGSNNMNTLWPVRCVSYTEP